MLKLNESQAISITIISLIIVGIICYISPEGKMMFYAFSTCAILLTLFYVVYTFILEPIILKIVEGIEK